jgi:hypothetical protein
VKINPTLNRYQELARQKLVSEQGRRLRSRRGVEVESVFGRIKQDWGFRRFTLRGMEKVKIEWGLLCIAHNIAKMAVIGLPFFCLLSNPCFFRYFRAVSFCFLDSPRDFKNASLINSAAYFPWPGKPGSGVYPTKGSTQ